MYEASPSFSHSTGVRSINLTGWLLLALFETCSIDEIYLGRTDLVFCNLSYIQISVDHSIAFIIPADDDVSIYVSLYAVVHDQCIGIVHL